MAVPTTPSPIKYVGEVTPSNARFVRVRVRLPEPGPGEVLVVRGRTQTIVYHLRQCSKTRDVLRVIRRSVAVFRGLTLCEECSKPVTKRLDDFATITAEVIA